MKFECACGEAVSLEVEDRENQFDGYMTCGGCGSVYAVTITKFEQNSEGIARDYKFTLTPCDECGRDEASHVKIFYSNSSESLQLCRSCLRDYSSGDPVERVEPINE